MRELMYAIRIIKREFAMISSRNIYIVALFIIPVFSIIFLSTIFGKGIIEEVPIGAVDYSHGKLSGEILDKIDASPTLNLNEFFLDEETAIEAMHKLKIYGFVVIPPDFERKLYSGEKPEVLLYYHKSVLAVGEEVNGAFLKVMADVAGELIDKSGSMGGVGKEVTKAVAMPVNINGIPEYNSDLNFRSYITYPFIFIFLQILLIVFTVYIIGEERISVAEPTALICRMIPYIILFSLYAIASTILCFTILEIPSDGNILELICAGILLFTATIGVGILIKALIPNLSIAISIASMYGALGATTCGVTFPIEQMSEWVQVLAELFPVRDFTRIYHNLIYRNLPLSSSINEIMLLAAFSSLILIVPFTVKRLGRERAVARATMNGSSKWYGVILIVIGGTIGYSILYNMLYLPNSVKDVPVAVCDASSTPLSRTFISYLDATEGVDVTVNQPNYYNAVEMMKKHKVRGIIYIPADFGRRMSTSKESVFILKGTTTSFLYYMAIQESCVGAMQQINNQYRGMVINSIPLEGKLALAKAPQLNIASISLTNSRGGYATFLIPVVLIVALFQTMIMAMGVVRGKSIFAAIYFTCAYSILSLFVLGVVPHLFNLPDYGKFLDLVPFIILFLLATSTFGYFLSSFFTDNESVNLIVPFFSIGLIFLSGMSFPRECMPWIWQMAYYIFPCTSGITGYIKLNSLGAPVDSVCTEAIILAAQCAIYGFMGWYLWQRKKNRDKKNGRAL